MTKPLFGPTAGLIQDLLLLSGVFLMVVAIGMLIWLRLGDFLKAKKRRKAMQGRLGWPVIQ